MAVIELVREKTVTSEADRARRAATKAAKKAAAAPAAAGRPRSRRSRPKTRRSPMPRRRRRRIRPSLTSPDAAPVRLRLDIAYDGTDFNGWAAQDGLRTVAGVLDEALSTVFRSPVAIVRRGAHRRGCACDRPGGPCRYRRRSSRACLRAEATMSANASSPLWFAGSRRFLPEDVRVRQISPRTSGFRCAASRHCAATTFIAFRWHRMARIHRTPASSHHGRERWMSTRWLTASRSLLGLHDFAAFCRHRPGATTIRELQRMDWIRDADLVTAHVTADAFCWSMVRSLVGALLAVGEGRREPAWCATLLTATAALQRFRGCPGPRAHLDRESTIRPMKNWLRGPR